MRDILEDKQGIPSHPGCELPEVTKVGESDEHRQTVAAEVPASTPGNLHSI